MAHPITLTSCQAKAADAFFDFLMSDDRYYVISGSAGTGKTTLMTHLADKVLKQYEICCQIAMTSMKYDSVVYTATTNKAAKILTDNLGKEVKTIHSYLGLKVSEDTRTGKTMLTETDSTRAVKHKILFIDECSMIDQQLFDRISELTQESKVVFIGDHAQLAPVNESLSVLYAHVAPHNFSFLEQPVRNAHSPALMALCKQLRQTVETGIFHKMAAVPGSIEYLDDTQMQAKLAQHFMTQSPDARVLCYTNTRVQAYIDHIRQMRNLPNFFTVGDELVVAQAHIRGGTVLSVEAELTVLEVDPVIRNAGYESYFSDNVPIQVQTLKVKTSIGGELKVDVPVDKDRWLYAIKRAASKKRWSDYFNIKGLCADLRDKSACTVYKSQGSTYHTVFVDLGNIGTSFDAEQVARMLFVAVSRASDKVYFYGDLPARYRGANAA